MEATALYIHRLALASDYIRRIHQMRGFMELKSVSAKSVAIPGCAGGGHLLKYTRTHTQECTHAQAFNTNSITVALGPPYLLKGSTQRNPARGQGYRCL